ncbi:MAG: KH domain-containing protein [Oscillospiraceae bacterium]|nr:KH domain-containing protein [Oscillospiraceae bacterium]
MIGAEAEINITEKETANGMVVLELSVAKENMGKVIGRKGRIAKAIRTVMKAYANKKNQKVIIEII